MKGSSNSSSGNRNYIGLIRVLTIIVPLLFISVCATAQDRIEVPVKMKIEDGSFDEVSVVLKNTTTNETNTVPGSSKFNLELKMNSNYIISFSKPGYITKKIAFDTRVPSSRLNAGFYPFTFEVNLFEQYDGVNIVVFNQPVGKISYSRLIDDFDYDTDYTKQIQSQLKAAEDEILKKQKEAKEQAVLKAKEEEKKKAEAIALAKLEEKEKKEAAKKELEDARILAAEEAKQKKLEEEQRKLEAKAIQDEEKRQRAVAQIEEEERARLKAAEDEEKRKNGSGVVGNDSRPIGSNSGGGDENRSLVTASAGDNNKNITATGTLGNDSPANKPYKGFGSDEERAKEAKSIEEKEGGIKQAKGIEGEDIRKTEISPSPEEVISTKNSGAELERLPDFSVEEIKESNKTITKVTVRNGSKETVFSKVLYSWGGVFYFRDSLSISQSMYKSVTGLN